MGPTLWGMRAARTYRKTADSRSLHTEAASLRWLRAAGGARVVELVDFDANAGYLTTRLVREHAPTAQMAYEFGQGLALTHAAGAEYFGALPPGLSCPARFANLDLPAGDPAQSWGEFYAECRLQPYLDLARRRGGIDAAGGVVVEKAIAAIAGGDHTSALPALCRERGVAAARTHGDLWGGNVLWGEIDDDAGGWLIDPAAHGAHAETDLAALALFGSPHLADTVAGYQAVSPLAEGWRERVGLHQLHMLLVHAALFGAGYGRQCVQVARSLA